MEFIFENPILLFLLIGLISSLFKKVKGEQEQQPKRPIRPEQQGPASHSEDPMSAEPFQPMRTERPESEKPINEWEPSSVPENPFIDIQKKYQERREAAAHPPATKQRDESPQPAVQVQKDKDEITDGISIDLSPEADRLLEGIAWAQVLEPPRSRNPYRTARRR
ncbi:hypothetical protein SAMN05192533_10289 [Mesobacillus persicus]|uniref:Uncharacterized protein n=1 Tax=Mesobacillus persicus TaxID=930146 RepID=A0A1H7X7T9_9BACI|nr:hypothetical protein [Mesobacillus persicus]SEM29886.1 hypothetical protein SAMN05192533_10289 [Mesobacillus persicus]